ncbi:uncharacterized protein TEOVI_000562800 [Trypanosoma equiperdum]|uniref:Uncharacterized protein n=1 Tax=Trypanosoma equiperdum TaxID=5694 RepID=A0A1G4HYR3_TRYEQ|nr:hypothetical protein TEOVI_000562800 [Trypanosoma equiperdum]
MSEGYVTLPWVVYRLVNESPTMEKVSRDLVMIFEKDATGQDACSLVEKRKESLDHATTENCGEGKAGKYEVADIPYTCKIFVSVNGLDEAMLYKLHGHQQDRVTKFRVDEPPNYWIMESRKDLKEERLCHSHRVLLRGSSSTTNTPGQSP